MSDVALVIYEVLTDTNSNTRALCNTRVWLSDFPETWRNEEPAVVFDVIEETVRQRWAYRTATVLISCYGGSENPADAIAVRHAVIQDLHNQQQRVLHGVLLGASMIGGDLLDRDETTEWYLSRLMFEVQIGE